MKKVLNFGILGCGMIAEVHAKAINSLENAKLFGVADNIPELAKSFAVKYEVKAFSNYEEMLKCEQIDVVCICTPSCFHAENSISALNAGKHVALEKPMAISTQDTEKIINTCNKTGKCLTVISQLRFLEDVQKLKTLVEDNAFGKIAFCNLFMNYWRAPEYYSSSNWKGTLKFDGGGALMNQGIHGVDLLLYIAGNAEVVSAKTQTIFHDVEVEDSAIALLKFKNGALGTITASTCAFPGFSRKIEILGSNGCAILNEGAFEKLIINGETIVDKEIITSSKTASNAAAVEFNAHAKQISNLINTINGKESLFIDCFEGKKAVEIIEKIYKSN